MVINKTEIRIAALQRSGHHAIILWLLDSCDERGVFVNLCRPGHDVFDLERINRKLDYRLVTHKYDTYDLSKDCNGKFQHKNLLIYNYENKPLADVFAPEALNKRASLVGNSQNVHNVIILRDPLNALASYYHRNKDRLTLEAFKNWIEMWCNYADAVEKGATSEGVKVTVIDYNVWLRDMAQRATIAATYGLKSAPYSEAITKWGNGSSFSQTPTVDHSDFESRWRIYEDDETYKFLLRAPRLCDCAETYFSRTKAHDLKSIFLRLTSREPLPSS